MPRKSTSANQASSNSTQQATSTSSASTTNQPTSTTTKSKRARASDASNVSQQAANATDAPQSTSSSNSTAAHDPKKKQRKETRKKVTLACVYCRRSHMTCDTTRPCQRCIKRDIAHLCHDEPNPRSHPHGPVKVEADEDDVKPSIDQSSSPPSNGASTSRFDQSNGNIVPPFLPGHRASTDNLRRRASSTSSTGAGGASPFDRASSGPYSSASALGGVRNNGPPSSSSASMPPAIALTAEGTSPILTSPYSFTQGTGINSSLNNTLSASAELAGLRSSANGTTPLLSLDSLGSTQSQVSLMNSGGANGMNWFSGTSPSQFHTTPGASTGLGSASWLGLGGTTDKDNGELTSDAAGGSEFNILTDFLESLDGASWFGQPPLGGNSNPEIEVPLNIGADGLESQGGVGTSKTENHDGVVVGGADQKEGENLNASTSSSSLNNQKVPSAPIPPGFSSKAEKFFLTAADQDSGSRDERLARVIQAKYDAGLLRPYNPLPGYARLQSWCQSYASNSSRRRIMKPISIFRPAFKKAAQSLSNLDLIFEAEATERLLLDYDRVFSTQGVPACLWRRAGEIYQGNREFAELVGVPVEMLREGKLCIYELMTEESAVNYWEKYGSVSFDAGQKAVLTSCVLRSKNTSYNSRSGFSAANAVAAQLPRSQVVSATASGGATPLPTPGAASSSNLVKSRNGSISKPEVGEGAQISGKGKGKEKEINEIQESHKTASSMTIGNDKEKKKHVPRGREREEEEEGMVQIECCFSFTIRRDKVMIPQLIIGNFLPSRLD